MTPQRRPHPPDPNGARPRIGSNTARLTGGPYDGAIVDLTPLRHVTPVGHLYVTAIEGVPIALDDFPHHQDWDRTPALVVEGWVRYFRASISPIPPLGQPWQFDAW